MVETSLLPSEPWAATGGCLQIGNRLGSTTCLQLLHHKIRLDAQQEGLTRVSTASGGPSLQCLRLKQGLFAELIVAAFKTTLGSSLKGGQGRGFAPG
ncbi:hypothetical protein KR52_05630 [Synechococcus sp. KORDI-52]|nr:hypothetical protein KR52_05630 [Synechococcus sp. KORDI-52]